MTKFTPGTSPMAEAVAPAYRGANKIKALPFNPAKLKGLSEELVTSHHQHNYAAAVKRLNQVEQQIGALSKDAPPSQMAWLRREELIATNSMLLHDCYFDNLGGDLLLSAGAVISSFDGEPEQARFFVLSASERFQIGEGFGGVSHGCA